MPVTCKYDGSKKILAIDVRGSIAADELINCITSVASEQATMGSIAHVIRFHGETDLSAITLQDLIKIHTEIKKHYEEFGLKREKIAGVLDGSTDAQLIMPLWRAVFDADSDVSAEVKFFSEEAEASEWMGVTQERLLELLASETN